MDPGAQLAALATSEEFTSLTQYTKSFDLFKVMGVSTKELVHSNIIAALLNERESHGLGAVLRDAYVASLATCRCSTNPVPPQILANTAGERARISRELAQIDIVLDFPDLHLVIAIENKIWAKDQEGQIGRYQQTLGELYPHYPNRALVYLTPTGRDSPTIDPESSLPVYYQSYGQLAKLLRHHQPLANSAANNFIDQMVTHVEKTMTGNSDLRKLCLEIFLQNEDAYEHLYKNYEYCLRQKLDQQFADLKTGLSDSLVFQEWSGQIESRFMPHPDKLHYDLDIRLSNWPTGIWVKIYKHTWFGVFPFFRGSDKDALSHRLAIFTAPARQMQNWTDHYIASSRYLVKSERCIIENGDKATDMHLNHALNKVSECIKEISAALAGKHYAPELVEPACAD